MDETLYMNPTEFRASKGKFDSAARYLRNGTTLQSFPLVRGKTASVKTVNQGSYIIIAWRYSVAGYVCSTNFNIGGTSPGSTVHVTDDGFDADYSLVTT